jgi:uncharacterized protein
VDFFSYQLSESQVAVFFLVALFIGMAKTGVQGAGMLSVPLLATVFGGQLSTGVLLPILCIADILGILYYHRHASFAHLKKLFFWVALGTLAGTLVGDYIDDKVFKVFMGVAIILSVTLMIWLERRDPKPLPDKIWFSAIVGIIAGFTSMVGNLAGPMMAVYFLTMRLPKNEFIGTSAWFFLALNFFKVPFHVFAWKTITWKILLMDLVTIPVIILGAFIGVMIVRNLSDKVYRWFIIAMTLIAGLFMLR